MPKRMTISELEKKADRIYTGGEFLEISDILLADYLAFKKTEEFWDLNFIKNGKEEHLKCTNEEAAQASGILVAEVLSGKRLNLKEVSFMRKYNISLAEVLVSVYYTNPLEMEICKPKAITISSTTDFGLGKELVHVDKVREIYGGKAERTGKDPLMLLFEDNKMVFKPAELYRDNIPRYNLNLKYLVEAAKLTRA